VPAQKRVNPSNDTRDEQLEGGVTVMNDLMGGIPEVEVDAVRENSHTLGVPTVVIRVNDNIEDMSYVAGGRRERYTFETGNQYRVPVYIANELESLGKIWH
jgi:hypothetical protein